MDTERGSKSPSKSPHGLLAQERNLERKRTQRLTKELFAAVRRDDPAAITSLGMVLQYGSASNSPLGSSS